MKIKNKVYFYTGIVILFLIGVFYFINIPYDSGNNFYTQASLLSVVIFFNPFVLWLYILISIVLIAKSVS